MKISLKDLVLKFGFINNYPCAVKTFAEVFGNEEVYLNVKTLTTFLKKSNIYIGDFLEIVMVEVEDLNYDKLEKLAKGLGITVCERCCDEFRLRDNIYKKLETQPVSEVGPIIVEFIEDWLKNF